MHATLVLHVVVVVSESEKEIAKHVYIIFIFCSVW